MVRQNSASTVCSAAVPRKTSPSTTPPAVFSRKSSPGTPQTADFGPFFVRWANFFALASAPGRAGRTFSRSGCCDVTTLKPMTPLQPLMQTNVKPPSPMLAPKQRPLKPPSPLLPKNTPKTPISHPQRRCRFQLRLSLCEQRRWRFQLGGSKGDAGFTREIYGARGLWQVLVNAHSHAIPPQTLHASACNR